MRRCQRGTRGVGAFPGMGGSALRGSVRVRGGSAQKGRAALPLLGAVRAPGRCRGGRRARAAAEFPRSGGDRAGQRRGRRQRCSRSLCPLRGRSRVRPAPLNHPEPSRCSPCEPRACQWNLSLHGKTISETGWCLNGFLERQSCLGLQFAYNGCALGFFY